MKPTSNRLTYDLFNRVFISVCILVSLHACSMTSNFFIGFICRFEKLKFNRILKKSPRTLNRKQNQLTVCNSVHFSIASTWEQEVEDDYAMGLIFMLL